MVAKLSLSCRQVVAKLSPCVSWLDCWSATFFRIIPATTSRLNCSSRQVVARVCCFLRFCIKPMRYIYHPQLDCYLVAVNSDCSRPCELTLSGESFWRKGYFMNLVSNIIMIIAGRIDIKIKEKLWNILFHYYCKNSNLFFDLLYIFI